MDTTIQHSLGKSMSYSEYRDFVKRLVELKTTSGNEKTKALADYTKLNDRRMKRWDKMVKISEKAKQSLQSFTENVTWLVITESWCGDAAHVIPVLNKIADLNTNINLRLVLRDENPELMDAFLTNGNRAIPKVIMIDNKTAEVIGTYGPRPSEAASYVSRFKAKNGTLTASFKEDLQHWYNTDKGQTVIEDLIKKFDNLKPSVYL